MMLNRVTLLFIYSVCINFTVSEEWSEKKAAIMNQAINHSGCKQYQVHGHNYELWKRIDKFTFDNAIIEREADDLTEFQTIVGIKAKRDGLILLSPTIDPPKDALAFEIAVGCCNNKYISVRPSRAREYAVASADLLNVINDDHYTDFKILIQNGTLEFGIYGQPKLLTYSHEKLRSVKYMSFSCWDNNDAKFLYDCPMYNTEIF